MWELIDGWYVNKDNPQERMTPEQYQQFEMAQESQKAIDNMPTPKGPSTSAQGSVGGMIGGLIGSYYGGPVGKAIGQNIGSSVAKGDTQGISKITPGEMKAGAMSLVSDASGVGKTDAASFDGYNTQPELTEYATIYAKEAATDPTKVDTIEYLKGFVKDKLAGQTSGLIGGQYKPSVQTDSVVANIGEGFNRGGSLDTVVANAKDGNWGSALGGAAAYTYRNYQPPVKRRRYY